MNCSKTASLQYTVKNASLTCKIDGVMFLSTSDVLVYLVPLHSLSHCSDREVYYILFCIVEEVIPDGV